MKVACIFQRVFWTLLINNWKSFSSLLLKVLFHILWHFSVYVGVCGGVCVNLYTQFYVKYIILGKYKIITFYVFADILNLICSSFPYAMLTVFSFLRVSTLLFPLLLSFHLCPASHLSSTAHAGGCFFYFIPSCTSSRVRYYNWCNHKK